MSWYWWLALLAVAIFIVTRMRRGAQPKEPKEQQKGILDDMPNLQRYRKNLVDADRELAKVVAVIEALPVSKGAQPAGTTLTHAQLSDSLRKFLESKLMLEWNTSTRMVHVVGAPAKVTVFAKLQPTEPAAAMRVFARIADDIWAMETRRVDDMEDAIRAANREAAGA